MLEKMLDHFYAVCITSMCILKTIRYSGLFTRGRMNEYFFKILILNVSITAKSRKYPYELTHSIH